MGHKIFHFTYLGTQLWLFQKYFKNWGKNYVDAEKRRLCAIYAIAKKVLLLNNREKYRKHML